MTDLHAVVNDYLSLRRALGYKLQGRDRLLHGFIDFLEDAGEATVTTESALAWAILPPGGEKVWWSQRLGMVRGFARHLHAIDPAAEIPPSDVLPGRKCRATPYLYSDADVAALMTHARALRPRLLAAGYETLFGLLATTGMRVGEAIALDRDDLDAENELLVIRHTKFRKSREVPLHATTIEKLTAYAEVRDRLCPNPKTAAWFVSTRGTRFIYNDVHHTFRRLAGRAGLEPRSACCRPRLHDMRHGVAVKILLGWYRDGVDVDANLPLLSTLLGHADPANTYWYISAVPELMALAAGRVEHRQGQQP